MNVEKSQVCRCGQCKHECRKVHIDSFSREERKLWQDIAQATDDVRVTCPQCKEDLIQCRYCPFNLYKKIQKRTVCVPKGRYLFCTWERNISRQIITTRTVYPRFNSKEKDDGNQRARKEGGNPVMGVMWLTTGKVIFTSLLDAGASMSAGGVTLGKLPGLPGSSSQQRTMMQYR